MPKDCTIEKCKKKSHDDSDSEDGYNNIKKRINKRIKNIRPDFAYPPFFNNCFDGNVYPPFFNNNCFACPPPPVYNWPNNYINVDYNNNDYSSDSDSDDECEKKKNKRKKIHDPQYYLNKALYFFYNQNPNFDTNLKPCAYPRCESSYSSNKKNRYYDPVSAKFYEVCEKINNGDAPVKTKEEYNPYINTNLNPIYFNPNFAPRKLDCEC